MAEEAAAEAADNGHSLPSMQYPAAMDYSRPAQKGVDDVGSFLEDSRTNEDREPESAQKPAPRTGLLQRLLRRKKGDKGKYLWPDEDDTFHAYLYDKDLPRLNESYLDMKGQEEKDKAENLFNLLKLDNFPLFPGNKDRRFKARNEARNYAQNSKAGLKKMKCFSQRQAYLEIIKSLAQASGFFSVWMEVFKDDEEVKSILINAFKGTKGEYCRAYNPSST